VGKNQNIYQLIVGKVPPCIIYVYTDDDVDAETFVFMHGWKFTLDLGCWFHTTPAVDLYYTHSQLAGVFILGYVRKRLVEAEH